MASSGDDLQGEESMLINFTAGTGGINSPIQTALMESAGTESEALFTAVCDATVGDLSSLLPGGLGARGDRAGRGKPQRSDRVRDRGDTAARGHPGDPGGKAAPRSLESRSPDGSAGLGTQGIHQGAGGVRRDARCWSPLFSADALFAEGMKKVINFKKIKREQL